MKVFLLGGTGVFGSRLARLLVRDGHHVTIAGRNLKLAQTLADELKCHAHQMDRNGDLRALAGHDVLVDAAGPFHVYGADPYRLAKAALDAGMHYLDLSDNAAFCAGIAELDETARARGLCAISGLSSVPALSSAAVRALAGTEVPRLIDSAILPGNRSPRGLSVMASILTQAGRPMRVWRGGAWTETTGWSDPMDYQLLDGTVRQGWQIEVPDLTLFPAHFKADSVRFRAGLELWVMRYGLWAFAQLCRIVPIPITGPLLRSFKFAANLLAPFGSGRGGMSVMVTVDGERRFWRLLAEDGDGPFIPAVAARALLRRSQLPVGAAPALETITLAEAEAAMSDLRVRTERRAEAYTALFPRVLGTEFSTLPVAIQKTHRTLDISRWQGQATVHRGKSPWARLLAWVFRFPPAAENVPVEVIKTVTKRGETWRRNFGKTHFRSRLAATPHGIIESFGPFTFLLGIKVTDRELHYPVHSGRLGPLPLPGWLLPLSDAREFESEGVFHFDIRLLAPLTRKLIVHYQGSLIAAPEKNSV
ncbi:MAG: DUF4166 domain-containing protein [Thalassovita sp.]